MPSKITLIRHGETDWNAAERWQGHSDIPLNENGRAQARALAPYVRGLGITRIVSSDLARARETAELACAGLGIPIETDPRLREVKIGRWEGMTLNEIKEQDAERYAKFKAQPYQEQRFPEGDSRAEQAERVSAALFDLVGRYPGEHILVTTHGGTIIGQFLTLLNLKWEEVQEIGKIVNCSCSHLIYDEAGWSHNGLNVITGTRI